MTWISEPWDVRSKPIKKKVGKKKETVGFNYYARAAAIVCHGGVINAYLAHVLGIGPATEFFYPNYTSIHRVAAARTGERSILSVNETAHLRGTGLPIGMYHG